MALPSIPPPGTPFLNPNGTVASVWYLFLYNLTQQTTGVTAAASAAGNVSPGSGQADANLLFASSQALI